MSFRDRSIIIRLPALAALVALALLVLIGGSTARATLSDGDVVLGSQPSFPACTPGTDVNCSTSTTGVVNTESAGTGLLGFGDGAGVFGFSVTGAGVIGTATGAGTGVTGAANSTGSGTTGVLASSNGNASATALKAEGKSTFSGKTTFSRSGTVTVAAGTSSATKSPISLTSTSLVLATIQGNQAGVYVQGVTKVIGASGSFTIHLNKNATANLPVAWFVLN